MAKGTARASFSANGTTTTLEEALSNGNNSHAPTIVHATLKKSTSNMAATGAGGGGGRGRKPAAASAAAPTTNGSGMTLAAREAQNGLMLMAGIANERSVAGNAARLVETEVSFVDLGVSSGKKLMENSHRGYPPQRPCCTNIVEDIECRFLQRTRIQTRIVY
jgi:hypothetical protein